jgi:CubicO group peptidase (beta-lactamase class C family)
VTAYPKLWSRWYIRLASLLLYSVSLSGSEANPIPYWPSDRWRASSPEAQGIDSGQLAVLFDAVKAKRIPVHSIIVVRNGYLVLEAYFYPFAKGTVHDLASMTKSVLSTLVGIAIDQGRIKSVDQPVLDFFPNRGSPSMDGRWRRLTIRHLLTMTSGFCKDAQSGEQQLTRMRLTEDWVQFLLDSPFVSDPGERFAYCSCASNLLSAVLTRASGMNARAFASRYLYGPLGIREVIWPEDPQGNSTGWGDSYLLPSDMAKLGYLFLRQGVWNGRQILSPHWIREATQSQVRVSEEEDYGYKWWIPKRLPGGFEAHGRGGQRIVVLPSKQLVVVLAGIGQFDPSQIGAPLVPAIRSDEPLPDNPAARRLLSERIREAARPPQKQPVPPLPELARKISGRTLRFQENPYGLKTMQLLFSAGDTGTAKYSFYEPMNRQGGTRESPFGLDGVYRISNTSLLYNLPVAARGEWIDPRQFDLELHMAGFNHLFRFRFQFAADLVSVRMLDDGVGEFNLQASIEKPFPSR